MNPIKSPVGGIDDVNRVLLVTQPPGGGGFDPTQGVTRNHFDAAASLDGRKGKIETMPWYGGVDVGF